MAVALLSWWSGSPDVDAPAVFAAVGILLAFVLILAVLASEKTLLEATVAHAFPLRSEHPVLCRAVAQVATAAPNPTYQT